MKTTKKLLATLFALTFILNSCMVEKRKYLSGYNIEWKRSKETANITQHIQPAKSVESIQTSNLPQPDCNLKAVEIPETESLIASSDARQIVRMKTKM